MLLLSRDEVASLLTMSDALQAVEQGFALLSRGDVVMPQRVLTRIPSHGGTHLSMPVYVGPSQVTPDILAIKVVTVYDQNPQHHGLPAIQGVLLLHDAQTGALLALMDAEHLTAMRTGAASGIATRWMARENCRSLLIFGAGALAPFQAEAVCAVRPIERVTIVSRTGAHDEELCALLRQRLAISVSATRDVRTAVESADVICTATNSALPLFDGAWLRPGTHVNAVGAYTRDRRELDAVAIARSRIIVDQSGPAVAEAGDLWLVAQQGVDLSRLIVGELGNVVRGIVPGREDDSQITLFKSVGLAMQDAVTAARIYSAAQAAGIGAHFGSP
jgi:ornithine cyclodeaminase/alanine dehydrogenase-like protein (mu-crystallin family)